MMPSQVASYNAEDLLATDKTTADDNFDANHTIYRVLAEFGQFHEDNVALRRGAQIHRYSSAAAGVYAFSRFDRDEKVEYVLAFNNAATPQRVTFPDALTGRDVVEFYRQLRDLPASRTDEVLRFAALNGAASRAVGTYSGGMTQRLGLAVAVLPDAPVFLLDEPTAALDPDGLAAFYAIVERHAAEGSTVLFTSHQLGDVERLADRFAVLVAGRLVAVLTQRDLHERLARRGVMRVRVSVSGVSEDALARLRTLAPGSEVRAGEILVPGAPFIRPAALDALRAAGVEVLGLTADEGRLDEFYRELVGESG
jgi:Cu-processing system ATP-binding protein